MTPFTLDLAQIASTKLESLRDAFETKLADALSSEAAMAPHQLELILKRAPDGPYTHPAIDGAWKGFQWGGDHVRALVRTMLDRLDSEQMRDAARPNAAVVLASHDPTRKDERIDWSLPLFDSDGFEHALVVLGGVQVVTRHSFVFAVWDRRSLHLVHDPGMAGEPPLSLGNTPMTDEERRRRESNALAALRQIDQQDNEPADEAPRG